MSALTDQYFTGDLAGDRSFVEEDLNDLLNYRGVGGFAADDLQRGDQDTLMVVQHFWPDEDFDYTDINDRI